MADPITPISTFAGSVRKRRVYYQALFVALPPIVAAAVVVPQGWYQQLSKAVPVAKAVPTLPTQFAAPYQNTIPGIAWHRWQDPVNGGVKNAKAQPTQPTQFAVPASVAATPQQFGWYQPLSSLQRSHRPSLARLRSVQYRSGSSDGCQGMVRADYIAVQDCDCTADAANFVCGSCFSCASSTDAGTIRLVGKSLKISTCCSGQTWQHIRSVQYRASCHLAADRSAQL